MLSSHEPTRALGVIGSRLNEPQHIPPILHNLSHPTYLSVTNHHSIGIREDKLGSSNTAHSRNLFV